jgi:histidinol-phosphate aminotransferase
MMRDKYIRDHINSIKPYEPIIPLDVLSDQLGIPIGELIKLDANENPYGMPPASIRRLADLSFGHIYPDPESRYLREALSAYSGVPYENILVGAGADELIDLIMRLTMAPGEKMINCPPTFGFYDADAQVNNLEILDVRRKSDFSLDIPGIEKAVSEGGKSIFLANPNNPDGGVINPEDLLKILALPVLVVLDEAYVEFASPYQSLAPEVLKRDNLIVLRTFSKWGGLAGLRLGYGFFPLTLANAIMKIKQPYNVSAAAAETGLGVLEDSLLVNKRLGLIIREREKLMAGLNQLDYLVPYPSRANFILCKVLEGSARKLKDDLTQRGILIRYFNKPGLEDHVRFSIGKPEDTERLLAALEVLRP